MSVIPSPQLPPRPGYREVVKNGIRQYERIITPQDLRLTVFETEQASKTAAGEDALCELDAAYDQRLAAIEDALCELDAAQS